MAKMSLEELRKLRDEQKKSLSHRDVENKEIQIIVGMGTCGIAAGAKETLNAFIEELDENELKTVKVTQTGCMGLCYVEPTVEVVMPDMPDVIYGKVDPETAQKIVRKHIMGKSLVNDHVFDRPAADIVDTGANGGAK
ncbi:MAG TPA: (2Fe-2S) ferredoxin domain-containing protein [Sediminispirochaeta sp.]|nr:(2Fe-2S) ferredoxin domain-containing protein [Sediminispirochaeta sp.]